MNNLDMLKQNRSCVLVIICFNFVNDHFNPLQIKALLIGSADKSKYQVRYILFYL